MSESKVRAISEVERLRAAIATVHDHLHAGRVDEAHQACECAEAGDYVAPANIAMTEAAAVQRFLGHFNALAKTSGLRACAVIFIDSKTKQGAYSVQLGGRVDACKLMEQMMRTKPSTYMGEHEKPRVLVLP